MAADQPAEATAWIAVSPATDPIVDAHIQHAGGQVVGETHQGAAVLGRMVDWALAAQAGVHPELLVSGREPPGRVTLTVEVDDLEARLRWLRDLGARVLQEAAGAALVEDPEGNRALLTARRPAPPR
jgi:Glyoxalase-like domain